MTEGKIYAVDFDGTLAVTKFPEIIEPIEEMINLCKRLHEEGNTLILWTCRCGEDLAAAVEYCKAFGLEFDHINENIPENIEKWGNDSRKIFAHVYIDDKNFNPTKEEDPDMEKCILEIRIQLEYEEDVLEFKNEVEKAVRRLIDPLAAAINRFWVKIKQTGKEGK